MTLISVIAAILIEQFWQLVKLHQDKNYFSLGMQTVLDRLPEKIKTNQWLFIIALLIVPFVVVYLLHLILLNLLGGLLAILFNMALLLLCVSAKPKSEHIAAFLQAQQDDDSAKMAEAFYDLSGEHIETVNQPNSYITRLLMWQHVRRWFGVIFYFLLLGPAGVFLYRTLREYSKLQNEHFSIDWLETVLALFEWPVSRLLALTFFLSGSFDDALQGWKRQASYQSSSDRLIQGNQLQQSNQKAILSTGCAAISHDSEDTMHNDMAYVKAAQGMLTRSLVIWCAAVAVLTLMDVFI